MIIAFTSPRKGTGQTVTATLATLQLTLKRSLNINLVDINSVRDIEYYLNDTPLARSLDEFSLLVSTKALDEDTFKRKVIKEVVPGLFMTSAPEQFVITKDIAEEFTNYSGRLFDHTILDCVSGAQRNSTPFYEHADKIVMVVTQNRRLLTYVEELQEYYKNYKDKLIVVINKYSDNIHGYGIADIKKELKDLGLDVPVLTLPDTPKVIEESNDNNLKSFITKSGPKNYIDALDVVLDTLLTEVE
ncbi:hypothetical protein ABGV42_00155 [Paenibacillus pabuli]|uniref:hypothetical protein n=1 Tax=Paenibacillus pabuli TaxID=1472 RepID=UPI0032424C8A